MQRAGRQAPRREARTARARPQHPAGSGPAVPMQPAPVDTDRPGGAGAGTDGVVKGAEALEFEDLQQDALNCAPRAADLSPEQAARALFRAGEGRLPEPRLRPHPPRREPAARPPRPRWVRPDR